MSTGRKFLSTASGVVALVLSIVGGVFFSVGAALTIGAAMTASATEPAEGHSPLAIIGVIFAALGAVIGVAGFLLGLARFRALQRYRRLLDQGAEVQGQITEVAQNLWVRVNRRHPWKIAYRYVVDGVEYFGSESMLERPVNLQVGQSVTVCCDRDDYQISALRLP